MFATNNVANLFLQHLITTFQKHVHCFVQANYFKASIRSKQNAEQ